MKRTFTLLCLVALFNLGCSNRECESTTEKEYLTNSMGGMNQFILIKEQEEIINKRGRLETVRGFDSCNPSKTLYLYEQLRITKDSTVLDGSLKVFYPNGGTRAVFHFKNGRQEGESIAFWPNGFLYLKNFRYWGIFMGPQYTYDSTGRLEHIDFMTNDSQYWFLVKYDESAKIYYVNGQTYSLMTHIKSNLKVGDRLRVFMELPKVSGTHLSVHYIISNNGQIFLDTTLVKFIDEHNALFSGIEHRFKSNSKGESKLKVVVRLMYDTNNDLIKVDSFSKTIFVD